jgi:filamentous hemagglutinin family protein
MTLSRVTLSFMALSLGLMGGAIGFGIGQSAQAQVIPDTSLGRESSTVTRDVLIRNIISDRIDGGALRGSQLFHSFEQFSIQDGRGAYFNHPNGVENIFSRVTGGRPSEILGRLGVLGSANLFLINPSGILFGKNASLDVRGSFSASTASAFEFGNGDRFSATDPNAAPLLAVNLRPGLQYGTDYRGNLVNAATLTVTPGQTIAIAGDTTTHTGSLVAPGGTVQVLGNAIQLLQDARIDVSGQTGGGTVLVGGDFQGKGSVPNAKTTWVDANTVIQADAIESGTGGRVIVWADGTTHFSGKITAMGGNLAGDGGFVEVSGKQVLNYNGWVNTTAAQGKTGTLLLDPFDFEVNEFNVASINNSATNVILTADNNITFNAPIRIELPGVGLTAEAGNNIFVNQSIRTEGGAIALTAKQGQITVENSVIDACISDTCSGTAFLTLGARGNIRITNSDLLSRSDTPTQEGNSPSAIGIVSSEGSVLLDRVWVSTTNVGGGDAGLIVITAAEEVEINNSIGKDRRTPPGIFSRGNKGGIIIGGSSLFETFPTPKVIRIRNSRLSVDNDIPGGGRKDAGSVSIRASENIFVEAGSRINSSTYQEGDAGSVILVAGQGVFLSGGSKIFSDAGTSATGNAGGVGIGATSLSIIEASSISTSTFTSSSNRETDDFDFERADNDFGTSFGGVVLLLIRGSIVLDNSDIFSNLESGSKGVAGAVLIGANSLSLFNGSQIQTLVRGPSADGTPAAEGKAGNIIIAVDRTLKVMGRNQDGFPSSIFSSVAVGATGEGGNIGIIARTVQVRDSGKIDANNFGTGPAGDVRIAAQAVWLDNNARITAVSRDGQGGNVYIDATGAVILGRGSDLFTSTVDSSKEFGEKAGNIAIGRGNLLENNLGRDGLPTPRFSDRTLLIAGKTNRDNNIFSRGLGQGTPGGRISINTFNLQDIAERPDSSLTNDISTQSFFDVDGDVVINTLDVFPSFRADPLPDRAEIPKISETCDPRVRQETSQAIKTGKGGIANNPAQSIQPATLAGVDDRPRTATLPPAPVTSISPAQGWIRDDQGRILLTRHATDANAPAAALPVLPWSGSCYVH